jgi:phage virion morphogenesis protein
MSLEIRNTLSRGLAARARALSRRRPILDAIGAELVALTKRAFSDPALRPSPWPPRKMTRSPHALLVNTGALRASIRVVQTTNDTVSVGSDLAYAAVHQFGSARRKGRGGGIPARPFFPYDAGGNMTPAARARVSTGAAAALRRLLGL